jgi:uncharacterized protein (DUF4415 family)
MKRSSKTNWEKVDALKDSEIDLAEAPQLTKAFFTQAVRWPGHKQQITLRLDPDVLKFFKKQGKGYQTTINNVLRHYMDSRKKRAG